MNWVINNVDYLRISGLYYGYRGLYHGYRGLYHGHRGLCHWHRGWRNCIVQMTTIKVQWLHLFNILVISINRRIIDQWLSCKTKLLALLIPVSVYTYSSYCFCFMVITQRGIFQRKYFLGNNGTSFIERKLLLSYRSMWDYRYFKALKTTCM